MKVRATDFFYNDREAIEELIKLLDDRQVKVCGPNTLRIYKFILSIKVLERTYFGRYTLNRESSIVWRSGLHEECRLLKYSEMSTWEEILFCDKIENQQLNPFFFGQYIEEELNDPKFLKILNKFCRRNHISIYTAIQVV